TSNNNNSGQINLDYLDNIDLKLTCKELPKCIKRIQSCKLVLGDTLHINSHVEFDDVVVKYNFSGKSVIVVKVDAGTEKKPVTMKNVRFRFDKDNVSTSRDPRESFLLDVESHVTLATCKLRDSTEGCGARVHGGGQLKATGTEFNGNKLSGVEVSGAGSKAVLKEGCKLLDSTEGCGAFVDKGGHLDATGTTFSGNKLRGVRVTGASSKAVLKEGCTLSDSKESCGAIVDKGGHLDATGTTFSGNKIHGLQVGTGSTTVMTRCTLSDNIAHSAVVHSSGSLVATGTTFRGNKCKGVVVTGAGSKAVLKEGCTLLENEVNGAHVENGGQLKATGTEFKG
ncbi:hypothetical protein TSOC_015055, partial [Tetrabaena socialis]